jgi:hypothetical protein
VSQPSGNTFSTRGALGLGYDPNAYDLPNAYAPPAEPNPLLSSEDPFLKILGYVRAADSVLDKYLYTAQESDESALERLRAQAQIEAARAAQMGANIRVQPTGPDIPWPLVIGGGVALVGLFLLLRKEG